MKKLLFILLFTIPFIGFGQGWEKTFGGTDGEMGHSVQQTTDGGYIFCGTTISFGNGLFDVYLIKTDSNGVEQWNKTFGGTGSDQGMSVQQTTDGGYIITGHLFSLIFDNDVYLIKTDGNGVEQWSQTFGGNGGDWGESVQQTTDGGYIICGGTRSFGDTLGDVYLIKTDSNGIEQWYKTFGGTNSSDYGYSVQQTTDGGYIICGGGNNDVYLIKTDGNGVEQWSQTFGGNGGDWGESVQQTTDGGYIITGYLFSLIFDGGVYLIKTDSNGIEQWNQTYGQEGDWGSSVQQTTDGGYIICGWTSFINDHDVYLIKTDVNGDSLWTKTFGGTSHDWGSSIQQTTDGGYIICGWLTDTFVNNSDVYLIKTDGNGNVTSTFNIPTPSSNRKLIKVVDILGRETKSQPNTPFIEIYDDGSVEKKIVIE